MHPATANVMHRCTRVAVALLLALGLAGCGSMGPQSVQRDRTDYASVLASTWKEQTLLNVVKLRYGDMPVYLDVTSIISSSSLESQVSLSAGWSSPGSENSQSLGAYGRYTDRPTISYTPLAGEKFARYLLRPISPAVVIAFMQAGYPVDRILKLTTRGVNGVFNRSSAAGRAREPDPDFYRLLEAMRRIQTSEAIDVRIERRGAEEVALLIFNAEAKGVVADDVLTVRQILRLSPDTSRLTLTFGSVSRRDSEIALLTRSMAEIFLEMASTLEAPAAHVQAGRAHAAPKAPAQPTPWDEPLVRISSGADRPDDAYAAVRYREHWFWIDDTDMKSKSMFSFVQLLLSLAETGATPQAPLITVPVN